MKTAVAGTEPGAARGRSCAPPPTAAAGATGSEQLVAGRRARRTARVPQPGRTRTATKMLAVRDHNTGQRAVHPRGGEKEVPALSQHMVGAAAKAATEVTFRTRCDRQQHDWYATKVLTCM